MTRGRRRGLEFYDADAVAVRDLGTEGFGEPGDLVDDAGGGLLGGEDGAAALPHRPAGPELEGIEVQGLEVVAGVLTHGKGLLPALGRGVVAAVAGTGEVVRGRVV